jgi:hypothetical protein
MAELDAITPKEMKTFDARWRQDDGIAIARPTVSRPKRTSQRLDNYKAARPVYQWCPPGGMPITLVLDWRHPKMPLHTRLATFRRPEWAAENQAAAIKTQR